MNQVEEGRAAYHDRINMDFLPAGAILRGDEDLHNVYWNSFLPIFFDRMTFLMRKAMNDIVEPYGLTSAHAFYLIALDLIDGQTQAELSQFLDMDAANTNRVIKVLNEKGLVTDDRRTPTSKKYHIHLTDKGKKIADEVMVGTQKNMNSIFSVLTTKEIESMREMLIRVMKNADPDFMKYVDSPFVNPFYVYLGTNPPGENMHESVRDDIDEERPLRWD